MNALGTWVRALALAAWNLLAVHGLFHLHGWDDVRENATVLAIGALAALLVLWKRKRDADGARRPRPSVH